MAIDPIAKYVIHTTGGDRTMMIFDPETTIEDEIAKWPADQQADVISYEEVA